MKHPTLIFLLVSIFLSACTPPLTELAPEKQQTEFLEFEGVVEMGNDVREIRFGSLDDQAFGRHIDLTWEIGEEIRFASADLEFEETSGLIVGAESCQEFSYTAAVTEVEEFVFVPAAEFWACLEVESCDPGEEVFWFYFEVRFKD